MDPLNALVTFVLGRIKEGVWASWLRFIFELSFSAIASFLFVCGTLLITSKIVSLSIGSGMVMAAVAMVALFRREKSKLTKNMTVILPEAEAAKEIATDLQTIQKN